SSAKNETSPSCSSKPRSSSVTPKPPASSQRSAHEPGHTSASFTEQVLPVQNFERVRRLRPGERTNPRLRLASRGRLQRAPCHANSSRNTRIGGGLGHWAWPAGHLLEAALRHGDRVIVFGRARDRAEARADVSAVDEAIAERAPGGEVLA